MGNIRASNELKKFIEENIELIKNYDLGALHVNATCLSFDDKDSLYRILRDVKDSYTWLQNTSTIPEGFFSAEKVDTITIPPDVNIVSMYAIYHCNINKIVCKGGTDIALRIGKESICKSLIKTFITERDIHLRGAAEMMYDMNEFETHNNIMLSGAPPFGFVYDRNKGIHFTVSQDSKLVYLSGKFPDELLAEHLINIGFRNVTVV